jgi:hypothetical protein
MLGVTPMVRTTSGFGAACLALALFGCSGGEVSLTEYVDQINAAAEPASRRGAELIAEAEAVTDFTPQLLQTGLDRGLQEIRIPLQEAVEDIDPPDQISELHDLMWEWHAEFIAVEGALAARAGEAADTAAGWEALSDSTEMAAYRNALAAGKRACTAFQSELDATEARGAFAETPWIPGDLKEIVNAVLGCEWFPEHPEDVFRYPPITDR